MTLEEWLDLPETLNLLYAVGGAAYVDAVYEVARLHAAAFAEPDPESYLDALRTAVSLGGAPAARQFLARLVPAQQRGSVLDIEAQTKGLLSICDEHLYTEETKTP